MKPPSALFFLGRPLSPIYSAAMRLRTWLYNHNILKSYAIQENVISVGNLTMGGSGKTPFVQKLARHLIDRGYRPAVVSRGYGGTAKGEVNVVSDGSTIFLDPVAAGDEPYLLAASVPGLAVLTGTRRVHPCRWACAQLGCNILLLDDGFQHLGVQRDLNLVLFNASTLDGNGRVFPGGDLREPYSALQRADALILTGMSAEYQERTCTFARRMAARFPHLPIFHSSTRSTGIYGASALTDRRALAHRFHAFCGIANPERFLAMLRQQNIDPTGWQAFADHAPYNQPRLDAIIQKARTGGASALITTEKDWVKLAGLNSTLPLYHLRIEADPDSAFWKFLNTNLSAAN